MNALEGSVLNVIPASTINPAVPSHRCNRDQDPGGAPNKGDLDSERHGGSCSVWSIVNENLFLRLLESVMLFGLNRRTNEPVEG